jgi:hypothetical protein
MGGKEPRRIGEARHEGTPRSRDLPLGERVLDVPLGAKQMNDAAEHGESLDRF